MMAKKNGEYSILEAKVRGCEKQYWKMKIENNGSGVKSCWHFLPKGFSKLLQYRAVYSGYWKFI